MAKAKKGCLNDECIANEKKMRFKAENNYCPRCGQPLYYVCGRCGMKLAVGSSKYCIRCENEIRDRIDRPGKTFVRAMVSGLKSAGGFVVDAGQKVAKATGDFGSGLKESAGKFIEEAKSVKKDKKLID